MSRTTPVAAASDTTMDADAALSVAAFGGLVVGLSPAPLQSPPSQMHTVPVPWPIDCKL